MIGVKRSIFKCLYVSHLKHVNLAFVAVLSFFVFFYDSRFQLRYVANVIASFFLLFMKYS